MTDKQREASRRNGAKSHGPITPEGKQRSAQNAATHALTARRMLVLANERFCEFEKMRRTYIRTPSSPATRSSATSSTSSPPPSGASSAR
ncbi:MAG: hypothetical protein HYZ57_15230 [Acidobacteria bacterium]|nr:hypothetical protein [Acidobacteriota bacterium]MBI3281186.1 hypothetical protein [Acidobacteriota bacterium]